MGYGAGPKMQGILAEFWSRGEVVTFQNGFHGPQFLLTQETTQGVLVSPTLFNVVVDKVVQHWLSITVEEEPAVHDGLEMALGRSLGVFCADDGIL